MTESLDFLTVAEVEALHDEQLQLFGGLAGIRDRAALESAVGMPSVTFGGELLHPTAFDVAAAYAYHLAENHPFIDGNKRTALNAALVFLGLNGWDVDDPDERLYDAMIEIASGEGSKQRLAELLRLLASPVENE